jgi:hypothetical protein
LNELSKKLSSELSDELSGELCGKLLRIASSGRRRAARNLHHQRISSGSGQPRPLLNVGATLRIVGVICGICG